MLSDKLKLTLNYTHTHTLTHSLTHSLTHHSLTHSLTHSSLTHTHTHTPHTPHTPHTHTHTHHTHTHQQKQQHPSIRVLMSWHVHRAETVLYKQQNTHSLSLTHPDQSFYIDQDTLNFTRHSAVQNMSAYRIVTRKQNTFLVKQLSVSRTLSNVHSTETIP